MHAYEEIEALVRAALADKPQCGSLEVSPKRMRLIVQQGLAPLVYPVLVESGELRVESGVLRELKAVCVRNMQMQAQMGRVLEKAWKGLEDAGIRAVLMKGAGLAALYSSPDRRQWSDIDLFVGKEQYHAACAAMRATFPDALKFDEELEHYKHYNLIAEGVSIEVHRVSVALHHPCDERLYARMEREGMEKACALKIGDRTFKVFEPTFNVLMVFLHSWEHVLTQGANLRQLCDLTVLTEHYKDQIDWKRLRKWLKALHVEDVWEMYRRWDKKLVEFILRSQESGVKNQDSRVESRFVRKWRTMKERMANAERIGRLSPAYARHMKWGIWLRGLQRLFAKDRKWE